MHLISSKTMNAVVFWTKSVKQSTCCIIESFSDSFLLRANFAQLCKIVDDSIKLIQVHRPFSLFYTDFEAEKNFDLFQFATYEIPLCL